ncbi:TIGR04283 family arsenosugar biosynthesis glycosyltransferase [Xanthovirga aplysinae]|uniref:TIGR04283 family arsenosugar biosynthesis glycosyltransferase n=1 Tax=Xanthovirga aplysinae TaxID=2529853 RepID=UPI0012BB9D4D|nr:TIGR04283 family arsenosugar biosynthesis glycosyltransferase [Xanthovirga aplysinae]MTI32610.1 glycosyltransferase [Xanthovirga aplysinae]
MLISIIIPTYNESEQIESLIHHLQHKTDPNHILEIIVVDGNSQDGTIELAKQAGAKVISASKKGRASQMNEGSRQAKGEILYFLHGDTFPPINFSKDIQMAIQKGAKCGCYSLSFDKSHWLLEFIGWLTSFNVNAIRFGDQSLFVTKDCFIQAGGFSEEMLVMEDHEIIPRLRKYGKFVVMNKTVQTSTKKFQVNGTVRLMTIFVYIYILYYLGASQTRLTKEYRRLIKKGKI